MTNWNFFCKLKPGLVSLPGLGGGIYISKPQRILCLVFQDRFMHILFVIMAKFSRLHNSHMINFPIQSYQLFYSFCTWPSHPGLSNTLTVSLLRDKTPTTTNECPAYEINQSDGEAPVMLELWGIRNNSSLLSLLDPLWHKTL